MSRAAGVGVATVSRALAPDPHPDVSAAKRERVREAADLLRYRPSGAARALRTGAYHALSIVLPDDAWGWWEPTVRSSFLAAAEEGHHVLVHPIGGRTGGAATAVDSLADVPTDGVLLFGSANDDDVLRASNRLRLPVVTIDDVNENVLFPTLSVDNRAGAQAACEHLIASARRRIVYVGTGSASELFVRERFAGYRDALTAAGLAWDERLVVQSPEAADESIVTLSGVSQLIITGVRFDAVFCEYDLLAAPLLRTLRLAGLRVPEDVAVVGFDDERAAQLLDPQLTTMRQPYGELGHRAVELLLDRIRGNAPTVGRQLIRPTLVQRHSG
ncbi:LacI family DNA-binding transcriptional regulator [Microbacterium aurantiacum]|uniref:LacI family DNA-binding transcriptional regulator n=1 Tax=Microbacterium aurantiacum TaxID=162393 RepID=UPI00263532A0|nr:LacI family DNA-binding transcriptional regulator [Microbacterium aurantiacum]